MTEPDYRRQLRLIMEALGESVVEMSDEEILQETREDGKDPEEEAERIRAMILRAMNKGPK